MSKRRGRAKTQSVKARKKNGRYGVSRLRGAYEVWLAGQYIGRAILTQFKLASPEPDWRSIKESVDVFAQ